MGLSAPQAASLDIIALQPVNFFPWMNPMGLSVPIANYLDIIVFQRARIYW